MFLLATILHLGHNSILKQFIKVDLNLNNSFLVHFEKLWSSLFT